MSWLSQQNDEILRTESNPFDDPVETEECPECGGGCEVWECDKCGNYAEDCTCETEDDWFMADCPNCDGTGQVEVE